jgi:hypothetical protein
VARAREAALPAATGLVSRAPRRAPTEHALVRASQAGSAPAMEELFRRHWPAAHRAAVSGGVVGAAGERRREPRRHRPNCGRPGIRIHRTASVAPHETTIHHDIPVTAPARTLLDLAGLPASRPSSTPTTPAAPSRRASSRRRCSRSAAPTASRDRWSTRTRAGHRVVRCTDRQIAQDARTVAATLAAALGAGAVAA